MHKTQYPLIICFLLVLVLVFAAACGSQTTTSTATTTATATTTVAQTVTATNPAVTQTATITQATTVTTTAKPAGPEQTGGTLRIIWSNSPASGFGWGPKIFGGEGFPADPAMESLMEGKFLGGYEYRLATE